MEALHAIWMPKMQWAVGMISCKLVYCQLDLSTMESITNTVYRKLWRETAIRNVFRATLSHKVQGMPKRKPTEDRDRLRFCFEWWSNCT